MIHTVISGGQTGVDQAALKIAKEFGFKTGGYLPSDGMTHEGPRLDFIDLYGMQLHKKPGYPPRTASNVMLADATLRIYRDKTSPGEKLTLTWIKEANRPYLDVDLIKKKAEAWEVAEWLKKFNVINIAGNAERTAPGIHDQACTFLTIVFKVLLGQMEGKVTGFK